MGKYLALFILGFGVSLTLMPLVRFLAIKLGAMDLPGERKIHNHPIPRLGGVSIFIAFNLLLFISSRFDYFHFPQGFLKEVHFGWTLFASAIIFGIGAVDDFRRITPRIKFFFQILAGVMVATTCQRMEVISSPLGTIHLGIWSIPVTVFWVVAITNAINLLDGLDGLAGGTSFIACLSIFGISILNQNIGTALVSSILAGSILGFLKYNFHPASIFMGDSGAYFLGFILSVLSLQASLKETTAIAILIPIIALGLPIMDTALSMFRRLLKSLHIMEVDPKKNVVKFFYFDGWSVFSADKDHIHHRLLQLGFTQKKAVVFLYGVSLVLGALALFSVYFNNMNDALLITSVGIAAYIGVRKLGYSEIQVLSNGALLPFFNVPVVKRKLLRVFVDMAMIGISYYLAFLLRYEGNFSSQIRDYYLSTLPLIFVARICTFYLAGLYKGAWRYASISDLVNIIKTVLIASIITAILIWIIPGVGIRSWAVLLIDFNLLLLFVIGVRSSFRILEYLHASKNNCQGRKVLICGVEKGGVSALKEFLNNPQMNLKPIGFIDDDPRIQGKQINGYPVLGTLNSLSSLLKEKSINEVILAINDISNEKFRHLTQACNFHRVPLRRFQIRLEDVKIS